MAWGWSMFVHKVWFTGRLQPESLMLPSTALFDNFEIWARGHGAGARGFLLRGEDADRLINFEQVQMMTVQRQVEVPGGPDS